MADNDQSQVLTVNIVTPDGVVYSHHAHLLVVKAIDGDLGIMANHEAIIAPLKISEVRVHRVDENHMDSIAVNGGFLEVSNNQASITADSAERAKDIDLRRAQRAKARAEEKIKTAQSHNDSDEMLRAQVALRRAVNRISVSGHQSQ
ncbi:F0F1 ATP synthase subunit epsilon [Agrilactobacillus composti DSM 18527 = JCM 14202]|uniref:ATP synthase epsilon chain n=1 Tax=Agrilactobacillus composti DSM 18527 = JCM 14202 TaxID=1423734 RepID=X0PFL1_9LACO|nr:F0F1 ATP synthase subunit epsilon [Agrilactobacillus composti]KRM36702.1 F0F1 ATP synthase subunit epsilon [Agrilactobacillus composti DSM 18527 = JCM 14202]GAF40538.1 ATP synthase epsilon chain [Agrilactobacillus composti DSM 18527 = JCM 14202]